MKLFTTVIALFGCLASAFSQTGTNLVTNGDFNGLAPWTATDPVAFPSAGTGIILQGGTPEGSEIAQDIQTTPGSFYYLSLRVVESTVAVEGNSYLWFSAGSGGHSSGSSYASKTQKPGHYGWVFKAGNSPTKLRIGASNAVVRINQVSVIELPASPYAGNYTGIANVAVTVGVSGPVDEVISAKKTERVVARVLSTGQIIILRGTDVIATGIIFPNGDFSVRFDGQRSTGRVEVSGKRLKLNAVSSFNEDGALRFSDEEQPPLDGGKSIEFNLTRSGR